MTKLPTIETRCVHFTGVQNERCSAGVDYTSVQDSSERPWRWPCCDADATTSCATRVMRAPAAAAS